MNLRTLYASRFSAADLRWKSTVWRILWEQLFRRWAEPGDTLVDLGAGSCELVNAATVHRRVAVDLNPQVLTSAAPGVEAHVAPADRLPFLADGSVDLVFTSNLLEHLADKAAVLSVLHEARRILAPGGRLIALGPNVRYLPGAYWDFFDHHVALTDRSLTEALRTVGFELVHAEPRCLPYTIKSPLPRSELLLRLHLWSRPLSSWLVGKQFLLVARVPRAA
jgi:dolichol-phosphate mannosyltransferase